jgi:hypothetical protein
MTAISFDLVKPTAANSARQDEMTNQVRLPRRRACETDARLENNTRLLRNHARTAARTDHPGEPAEKLQNVRIAAGKKIAQRKSSARMPHVPAGEPFTAPRAFPKRPSFPGYYRHDQENLARSVMSGFVDKRSAGGKRANHVFHHPVSQREENSCRSQAEKDQEFGANKGRKPAGLFSCSLGPAHGRDRAPFPALIPTQSCWAVCWRCRNRPG